MSDLDTGNSDAWEAKYPTPATPKQLQNLAELYGLRFELQAAGFVAMYVINGERVLTYYSSSPIERYIARITEWRREGL